MIGVMVMAGSVFVRMAVQTEQKEGTYLSYSAGRALQAVCGSMGHRKWGDHVLHGISHFQQAPAWSKREQGQWETLQENPAAARRCAAGSLLLISLSFTRAGLSNDWSVVGFGTF